MSEPKKGSGLHPKLDLPEGTALGSTSDEAAETRLLCPVCRKSMIPASIAAFVTAALRSAGGVRTDDVASSPAIDDTPSPASKR